MKMENLQLNTKVASSTASSIYMTWSVYGLSVDKEEKSNLSEIEGYRVYYQKMANSYVQNSNLLSPTTFKYNIGNLVADTYYKVVCIAMYSGNTTSSKQTCLDTSTMSWHVPVSIGSSIRAVLALSIIVFIVLLSRCSSIMRSHHHHYYHNHAHKSLDSKKPKSEYITPSPYNGSQDISNVNILNDDNNIYRMVHKKYMRDNDRLHNSSYIQCVHDRDKIHSNVKQDVSQVCTGINNPTSFLEIQNHSSILQATNLDRTTIKTIYVEEPHVPAYGQKTTAARQTRLAYLYSIHDSIRSTPDESTQPIHTNIPDIYHPTRSKSPWSPHVSISTLPPEVQISDPQIPVCHLLCKASDKTNNQVGTVRYA